MYETSSWFSSTRGDPAVSRDGTVVVVSWLISMICLLVHVMLYYDLTSIFNYNIYFSTYFFYQLFTITKDCDSSILQIFCFFYHLVSGDFSHIFWKALKVYQNATHYKNNNSNNNKTFEYHWMMWSALDQKCKINQKL